MNWLSRKPQPEPEPEDETPKMVSVPVSRLKRQFIYDMGLSHENRIIEYSGLTQVSAEVDEMEQRASEARVAEVYPIRKLIARYSNLVAEVMLAVSYADKPEPFDPDEMVATRTVFTTISHAAITTFLASFLDLGLLHGHYSVPYDDGDEDE